MLISHSLVAGPNNKNNKSVMTADKNKDVIVNPKMNMTTQLPSYDIQTKEFPRQLDGDVMLSKPYTLQTMEPGTSRPVVFRMRTLNGLKDLYKVLRGKKPSYQQYTLRRLNSYDYKILIKG